MKKKLTKLTNNNMSFDDHVGCFSNFDINDIICKKYCSLRLRCSIEHDQNTRLEILNDLIFADAVSMKMQ
jgi:hypothetical protein